MKKSMFMLDYKDKRVRKGIQNTQMPSVLHDAALDRYHHYLVVGGMQECVSLLKPMTTS